MSCKIIIYIITKDLIEALFQQILIIKNVFQMVEALADFLISKKENFLLRYLAETTWNQI